MQLTLAFTMVLLLVKFFAFYLTRSNAILTDALESIVNFITGSFALYSVIVAARPKDANHPYGHGKIEFLSSGLEGILIMLAGAGILLKAGSGFLHPEPVHHLDQGIILIAITGAANFGLGRYLILHGQRHSSATMVASGKHLLTDAYSTVGLLLGLGLIILTGYTVLDNIVAAGFGFMILYTGYKITRDAVSGVMDEADLQLIQAVIDVLNSKRRPDWIDVHNMRIIKYGSHLHLDCHLTLPWYYNLREAHHEMDIFQQAIDQHFGERVEIFIHLDPCDPPVSCTVCSKADCNVREHAFLDRPVWTLQNVITNKKHGL